MEHIEVLYGDEHYDRLVHEDTVPECGDLKMAVKKHATVEGRPCVVIAFTVTVDGQPIRVQAVTTLRVLTAAVKTMNGWVTR